MDINYKNYHRDESYKKLEKMFRNIFAKRMELIGRYLRYKKEGRVLDIGASTGVFLDLFKESGWETWGVEPSKGGDVAKKKGHRMLTSTFENAKLPKNNFDLVILNHTLEHMDKPEAILKKVYEILKKDGLVFVDVPNAGGMGASLLGEKWPHRLPDEHKHQFTKESLTKILGSAGFKVLHWESRSGIFEYKNPLLELGRKRFILDILTLPYSLLATALNIGDSMSFIAKK